MKPRGGLSVPLRPRLSAGLWLGLALPLLLCACSGGKATARRDAGSVLWLDSRAGAVSDEALQALAAEGVREIFLQAAELSWQDGQPRWTVDWRTIPVPRAPITLVVAGSAPPAEVESRQVVAELAERMSEAALEIQRRGGLPAGVHLDLTLPGETALAPLADLTARLGAALGPEVPVSVTLPVPLLSAPDAPVLARAASALAVFLYGQGARGEESAALWDLQAVAERLKALENLNGDYLVGVVTLGRMTRRNRSGEVLQATTVGSIRRLLDQRGVEVALGSALQAVDGRVYDFDVQRPVNVGPWRLAARDRLRIHLLTADQLRRFLELVALPDWEHHLGQVYYRPPRAEEGMALPPEILAGILSDRPPPPRVEVRRQAERRSSRLIVRLTVTNAGTESTEIAHVGNNFVELRARRGRFLTAERGDFQRYDQIDSASGRRSIRSDTVRLHAPFLAAGETLRSGDLVFAGASEQDLELGGSFLLPDGSIASVVEVAPTEDGSGDGSAPAGESR